MTTPDKISSSVKGLNLGDSMSSNKGVYLYTILYGRPYL